MDVTKIIERAKPGYVFQNMKEGRIYKFGVNDSGLSGIKAIGVHEIANVEKGNAVVGGALLITSDLKTATDAGTVKVQVNGHDVTVEATVDNFTAGTVVQFTMDAPLEVYADAADITVDLVVGTEALTAGAVILEVDTVNVDGILNRG